MRLKNTVLGTLALVVSIGCAPSNPGLTLEGVLATDTSCMVTATSDYLTMGILDIGTMPTRTGGISYQVAMQVGNQLLNNNQRVYPLMTDPDRIIVDHVEVTLQDTGGGTLGLAGVHNPYIVPAHGSIASTTSMDPTIALAEAEIIPSNYGMALNTAFGSQADAEIVAQLRVMGTTVGGSQLTSAAFLFPIRLCVGCLFHCACDTMGHPVSQLACYPGQDHSSGVACTSAAGTAVCM
jgi:hypothetical protein